MIDWPLWMLVSGVSDKVGRAKKATSKVSLAVQPLASVTDTEKVALWFGAGESTALVAPFDHKYVEKLPGERFVGNSFAHWS